MTPEDKQLIDEHGLIILPDYIDADIYRTFAYAVHSAKADRLTVFCTTDGGEGRIGESIAEMIRFYGGVTGVIFGPCISAGVNIFAACQHRFAAPSGWLGLHTAGIVPDSRLDSVELSALQSELDHCDDLLADFLASVSNADSDLWLNRIRQANHRSVAMVKYQELIDFEIAKPIQEWKTDGNTKQAS